MNLQAMGAETMQEIPFWKAVVITLGIIAAALGWMYVGSLLGFNDLWIPLVALTLWGAMGNDMKLVPGIFAGGAIGLLLALAIEAVPDVYGDWAAVFPVVGIVLAISCMIKGIFPLVCNFSLFIFLTIGGADVFLDQRPQLEYLKNLAYGALWFWILPWAVLKFRSSAESS